MPAPLLLVDDDLATIAQVKRILAREGYETVLASNAADAVIAWGHHLPPLVLLNPKVESDRGRIALEELRAHPDAKLLRVLLLGETLPGFGYPVAPLPLDPESFAQTVSELVQGTTSAEGWQLHVAPGTRTEEVPAVDAPAAGEAEPWRATRKSPAPGRSDDFQPSASLREESLFDTPDAPDGSGDLTERARKSAERAKALAQANDDSDQQVAPLEGARNAAREARSVAEQAQPTAEVPAVVDDDGDAQKTVETVAVPADDADAQAVGNVLSADDKADDADARVVSRYDEAADDADAQAVGNVLSADDEADDADARVVSRDDEAADDADAEAVGNVLSADAQAVSGDDEATDDADAQAVSDVLSAEGDAGEADAQAVGVSPNRVADAQVAKAASSDDEEADAQAVSDIVSPDDGDAADDEADVLAVSDVVSIDDDADAQAVSDVVSIDDDADADAQAVSDAVSDSEPPTQVDLPPVPKLSPPVGDLESSLFGDLEAQLAHDVEAQAMATVHESLANMPVDEELQALEDDVRAEAARRRKLRQQPQAPKVGLPTPDRPAPREEVPAEDVFSNFDEPSAAPTPVPTAPLPPRPSAPAASDDELDALGARLQEESAKAKQTLIRAEQAVIAASAALEQDQHEQQQRLDSVAAELQQRSESAAGLELELQQTRTQLEQTRADVVAWEEAMQQTRMGAEELADQLRERAEAVETARAESVELQARLQQLEEARLALEAERDALKAELQTQRAASEELSTAASRAAGALREAMEEAEQAEARADSAQADRQQAQAEAAASTQASREAAEASEAAQLRMAEAEARAAVAEGGLLQLQQQVDKLQADFGAAHQAQRNLEEALEDAKAVNLEVRGRADQLETKARQLEERALMPLKVPNRAPLQVARFGTVDLSQLAKLVGQLVLARAEVQLELAAPGGRRTIWLARGAVVAAESTFGAESVLDRARRDGLLDARQTADLQMIRNASPGEAVKVLKERGLVRDAEAVPLIQRFTEQVALDAFSEPSSEYRLTEDSPQPETLAATLPRPTLPLVAEALRRALPVDELLQRLGGSEAVPAIADAELDLRTLGFADKERRMLGYCDGEANVEDLALASGLKADVAFRAMLVAKLLGLIELKVPARTNVVLSPQIDVQRLEAKFEQVQEADYFTMLGLGRAAGSDEVSRAWQRLAEEFDPIKYSGHPDAGLQQRAQLVYAVLEEAARALGDDRRRAEYARHLVD